jgi:hypothetical protein
MTDRISFDEMAALVDRCADEGAQMALRSALNGINATERTMHEKIAVLRLALDQAQASLSTGRHVDAPLIDQAATALDRAEALRRTHWRTAAMLLTTDELAILAAGHAQPATAVAEFPRRATAEPADRQPGKAPLGQHSPTECPRR